MFKGFGKPKERVNPDLKRFVDANLKGYGWLKDQVSDDKDASQKLAQFVMRCLGYIKDKEVATPAKKKLTKDKFELYQMQFARMLAYGYYTQMSIALAEFEPTGVDGMSVTKTVDVLNQATDEQLQKLDAMLAQPITQALKLVALLEGDLEGQANCEAYGNWLEHLTDQLTDEMTEERS